MFVLTGNPVAQLYLKSFYSSTVARKICVQITVITLVDGCGCYCKQRMVA